MDFGFFDSSDLDVNIFQALNFRFFSSQQPVKLAKKVFKVISSLIANIIQISRKLLGINFDGIHIKTKIIYLVYSVYIT